MSPKQSTRCRWRNALIPATLFGLFTLVMSLALAVPAMTAALTSLVGLPSWCQESTGRPPFGLAIDTALDEALQLAAGLGLRTYRDPQGYYGWAELGEGDELLGLLGVADLADLPQRGVRADAVIHCAASYPKPAPRSLSVIARQKESLGALVIYSAPS